MIRTRARRWEESGDGSGTALLVVGLGVGGYVLYRLFKQGERGAGRHVAGAPCGPTEFWDDASKSCVPLSLPLPPPPTAPPPECPPGYFWDYFRGTCVSSAPVKTGWEY
ncbi:MAG TPA: hypothetical protein VMN82_05000 [Thermoanaerobaculia bacterium]|nr:hypothetical protein [Thermoanaerobaculia bacterium]